MDFILLRDSYYYNGKTVEVSVECTGCEEIVEGVLSDLFSSTVVKCSYCGTKMKVSLDVETAMYEEKHKKVQL